MKHSQGKRPPVHHATLFDKQISMEVDCEELFKACDLEDKGFVTKRDMMRLRQEMDMDPDQLERVFDTLDVDGNGYLTLNEFSQGFRQFTGKAERPVIAQPPEAVLDESYLNDDLEFEQLMESLGLAGSVGIKDHDALKGMWKNLKLDADPETMANFEGLLSKLTAGMSERQVESVGLEQRVRFDKKVEEDRIRQLYEDMDVQLQHDREAIRKQEEVKHAKRQGELEESLRRKESQLNQMQNDQASLQAKLEEFERKIPEIKDENCHLNNEKQQLLAELRHQHLLVEDMRLQMDDLRQKSKVERRKRAKAAFAVSEGIAMEREHLVGALHDLKSKNVMMMDFQDSGQSDKEQEGSKKTNHISLKDELDNCPIDVVKLKEYTERHLCFQYQRFCFYFYYSSTLNNNYQIYQ